MVSLATLGLAACAPDTLPARPPNATRAPAQQTQAITLSRYACDSGTKISASYPTTDDAVVQYQGTTYQMRVARSADGARYVGDALEWWTRGTGPGAEGTLYEHADDGSTGDPIESCEQVES
ncbi:MliC family protein [Salinisphaera aquimarina]|uniref:MliC family protein n=1 Tax=Salinisphaera aquimarina TaxID=2094031 RepID=A0ABV7EPE7_9GAMM